MAVLSFIGLHALDRSYLNDMKASSMLPGAYEGSDQSEASQKTPSPKTASESTTVPDDQNPLDSIPNAVVNTASESSEPSGQTAAHSIPHEGFVYLCDALPEAKFDVRYATAHNFTGQVVDGYQSDHISTTAEAAKALQTASATLKEKGYGILIYDAYRPKRAVAFFIEWGEKPEDNRTKAEFYPDYDKQQLFKIGYLARRSAHSRGSAIDLTIYELKTGKLVDMGSPYDFLGPISNHGTELITKVQTGNRNILKEAMKAAGFKELKTEWWHYQLVDEPYPDTAFDFVIK